MTTSTLVAADLRGSFDLNRTITFGFGQREPGPEPDVLRLGFLQEATWEPAAVNIRQPSAGRLELDIVRAVGVDAAAEQALRVLSADVDARGWDELGASDPLMGRVQAAVRGLRPPLFHSAYEALCWCVLTARRPHAQGVVLRDRLCRAHGTVLEMDGREVLVLPSPEQILAMESLPSLPEFKLRRLHAVARAALDGQLDTAALRACDPADALARLRALDGIGPCYAELVVVRALGHTDVLPVQEPTLLALAGALLGDAGPLTVAELEAAATTWAPWRTWAAVAIRAAGPNLLGPPVSTGTVRP